jgi:pimeloyl-ACP methyl ester carboxylesterase
MPFCTRDGLRFHFRDGGNGLPFVFQHGLGGDLNQPLGLYRPVAGVRLIAFDMRAHGETRPLGDPGKLTINNLADDLIAIWDHLGIARGVVGGISLGAAVAASVALRYPERVLGLVLSRPAWIDRPLPENVERYATIACLIREHGPRDGLERFRAMPVFQAIKRDSPDCATSLEGQFEQPRAQECVARLERLAGDSLCADRACFRQIHRPTLILGNHQDPIHPWTVSSSLHRLIPASELREITPKSVDLDRHASDVQHAIDDFLARQFLQPEGIRC